ncbi:hypothetical protein PENTCL1PPCAC_26978 [Pristionchus entomophagus]|uniref:Major sperm protein n=1 Tax=Pristionchus entomophagus TaxID=358040 RepID=A0AAV5UCX6_9BILA|nr:hypothetical protein PENTCL1PPCAC_26978 [Pristionchus entomophagus]
MADLEHKITFDPPKYVSFKPISEEQVKEVTVANTHNQAVMFKMKTTRPGVFKMKPVFFSLQPKTQKTIKLHYTGCPQGVKPNLKDRFSVIMAIVPKDAPPDWDVEKVWEDQKMQLEMADSVKRRVIRIHYDGYEIPVDPPEKSEKKSKKKKKGGSQETIEEPHKKHLQYPSFQPTFSAAASANAHGATPTVQPIVYIVYQGLPPREDGVEAK